jgi:hypothetical protein
MAARLISPAASKVAMRGRRLSDMGVSERGVRGISAKDGTSALAGRDTHGCWAVVSSKGWQVVAHLTLQRRRLARCHRR